MVYQRASGLVGLIKRSTVRLACVVNGHSYRYVPQLNKWYCPNCKTVFKEMKNETR